MKRRSRKVTIGRLVYLIYYKPVATVRRSIREGGPWNQLVTARARREMERTAREMKPVKGSESSLPSYEVHMLTGARFWYQSAFCIRSLAAHSATELIKPVFYDDGTLGNHRQHLRRIFPSARLVSYTESERKLDRVLPEAKFPRLHERWHSYPNIRKLIDPHVGSAGWKLVLDSDMLFFRRPDFLLEWLRAPGEPLYMLDTEESYGYGRDALTKLAGVPPPKCLNVGVCGLQSEKIDWDRLEQWIAALDGSGRTTYYLEQALVAMLLAGRECAVAPAQAYITWPAPEECVQPKAIMHHYVADAKQFYFRESWRVCLRRMQNSETSNGLV